MKAATINGESSAMFSLLCQGFPSSFPNMLLQNASAACHLFGCVSSFCLSFFLRRRLIYVGFEGDLRKREKLWHCVHFSSFFRKGGLLRIPFHFIRFRYHPRSLFKQTVLWDSMPLGGEYVEQAPNQAWKKLEEEEEKPKLDLSPLCCQKQIRVERERKERKAREAKIEIFE
jgi:hypothetical protein